MIGLSLDNYNLQTVVLVSTTMFAFHKYKLFWSKYNSLLL